MAVAAAAEEDDNNSTHGDIIGGDTQPTEASLPGNHQAGPHPLGATGVTREANEALKKELAGLHWEVLSLRQPATMAPAAPPQRAIIAQDRATGGDHPFGTSSSTTRTTTLRGPNSLLSTGLEAACWPSSFKMPNIRPYEGSIDPSEFLQVYETAIEAAEGDDTTKAKSFTLALSGMVLTWFFTIPRPPYKHGSSCETLCAIISKETTSNQKTRGTCLQ